jgi:hypothetical protein
VEERNQGGVAAVAQAPAAPELAEARAAFGRGDFRETRRLATLLLSQTDLREEARREADHLLASTSHDPLAVFLGVGCLLFFVIVVYFTLVR